MVNTADIVTIIGAVTALVAAISSLVVAFRQSGIKQQVNTIHEAVTNAAPNVGTNGDAGGKPSGSLHAGAGGHTPFWHVIITLFHWPDGIVVGNLIASVLWVPFTFIHLHRKIRKHHDATSERVQSQLDEHHKRFIRALIEVLDGNRPE